MAAKKQKSNIDLGLTVMCSLSQGETVSVEAIADVCGCSRQYISKIEREAIKKLKKMMGTQKMQEFLIHDNSQGQIEIPIITPDTHNGLRFGRFG